MLWRFWHLDPLGFMKKLLISKNEHCRWNLSPSGRSSCAKSVGGYLPDGGHYRFTEKAMILESFHRFLSLWIERENHYTLKEICETKRDGPPHLWAEIFLLSGNEGWVREPGKWMKSLAWVKTGLSWRTWAPLEPALTLTAWKFLLFFEMQGDLCKVIMAGPKGLCTMRKKALRSTENGK